jgi:nicotinate-nucleotide adenylyltransferase
MPNRIGIYAGAFDPVHAGHIAFALQAIDRAKLDRVYFMPERRPRYKQGVEHFGHRIAMLRRAVKPHAKCGVLDVVDMSFSVQRTLPFLLRQFPDTELVFLFGSDVIESLPSWPYVERLLQHCELAVGVRSDAQLQQVTDSIASWTSQPKASLIFESYAPHVSSGRVREALRKRQSISGLLASVRHYANRHWLYISLNEKR